MMRGYFYAGSKVEDKNALGGFGRSQNFPEAIDSNMSVRQGEISLIARPNEEVVFVKKYRGLKLLLVNTTKEQVTFSASDSQSHER